MSTSEHRPQKTTNTSREVAKRRSRPVERHGATADLALGQRASEIATGLRDLVPAASSSDDPTIQLLALVLARIEKASEHIDRHGILDRRGSPRAVLKVLSAWENTAARLLRDLGMTPAARAHLGLELVRANAAVRTSADLSKLSEGELAQLRALHLKAQDDDDGS
jgi:hypothetical protein